MLQQNRRHFSKVYKNYIHGKWVESSSKDLIPIICPLTQNVIGQVPQSTDAEFEEAVACSKDAFQSWKKTSVPQRVRYMLKY